jgi:CheY-like chemotaxis protein
MKVLLVDDTKTLMTLTRIYLMGWSLDFLEAVDGAEALRLARAYKPDLVISDIKMPVMDGLELCAAIRRSPELARTPVILLTKLESDETKAQGLKVGATAFLTKPISVEALRKVVAGLLGLSEEA